MGERCWHAKMTVEPVILSRRIQYFEYHTSYSIYMHFNMFERGTPFESLYVQYPALKALFVYVFGMIGLRPVL